MKSSTFFKHLARHGLGAAVAIFGLLASSGSWAEVEYTVRFDAMTSRGSNPLTDSLHGEMIIIAYDSVAKRIQTFISEPLKIPARSVGFGPDLVTPDDHLHPYLLSAYFEEGLNYGTLDFETLKRVLSQPLWNASGEIIKRFKNAPPPMHYKVSVGESLEYNRIPGPFKEINIVVTGPGLFTDKYDADLDLIGWVGDPELDLPAPTPLRTVESMPQVFSSDSVEIPGKSVAYGLRYTSWFPLKIDSLNLARRIEVALNGTPNYGGWISVSEIGYLVSVDRGLNPQQFVEGFNYRYLPQIEKFRAEFKTAIGGGHNGTETMGQIIITGPVYVNGIPDNFMPVHIASEAIPIPKNGFPKSQDPSNPHYLAKMLEEGLRLGLVTTREVNHFLGALPTDLRDASMLWLPNLKAGNWYPADSNHPVMKKILPIFGGCNHILFR